MNTKVLISVALICAAAQTTLGHVVRREVAAETTPSPADVIFNGLLTFFKDAEANVQKFSKNVLNAVGVEDEKALRDNVEQKVKTYTEELQVRFKDVQQEAEKHTGAYSQILQDFGKTLSAEIQALQTGDTTFADATKKYQDTFQNVVKTVSETANTLKDQSSGITEAFQTTLKKIVTETQSTAADVQKVLSKDEPAN